MIRKSDLWRELSICFNCCSVLRKRQRRRHQSELEIGQPPEVAPRPEDMVDRQKIALVKSAILAINQALQMDPKSWDQLTTPMRDIVAREELTNFYHSQDPQDNEEKLSICIDVLDFAYHDVDNGGDIRLVSWVERSLQSMLEVSPENPGALATLGRTWLYKSQQYLSKIAQEDGSSTSIASSGTSSRLSITSSIIIDWTSLDEDRDTAQQDQKRQQAVYVEARTALIPAVDFLNRAAQVMRQHVTSDVLVSQAEANMSLGNVTVSSEAQVHFRVALDALQKAASIQDFVLPPHLDRYLRSFEFVLSRETPSLNLHNAT